MGPKNSLHLLIELRLAHHRVETVVGVIVRHLHWFPRVQMHSTPACQQLNVYIRQKNNGRSEERYMALRQNGMDVRGLAPETFQKTVWKAQDTPGQLLDYLLIQQSFS